MTLKEFQNEWYNASDKMQVHTSGSTGKPKTLLVEKCRMEASARITCDFLGLKEGDSILLCMPLDYIAGKMVVVRSIVRHLQLIEVKPSGRPLQFLDKAPDFVAMVPMQVYNSMKEEQDLYILKKIKNLIIGGGAIEDSMSEKLKEFPNAVWSTYGMTETLSHIALRRLSGENASEWYKPFPSVNVYLNDDGCLVINAPVVCRETLVTNDIAEISEDGTMFRVIGRKDNVIDSGGIKIHIEDVEKSLRQYIHVPYVITKKKDVRFGEIVVMLIEKEVDKKVIKRICEQILPKYSIPKLFIPIDQIPLTETGKVARAEAQTIAENNDVISNKNQ